MKIASIVLSAVLIVALAGGGFLFTQKYQPMQKAHGKALAQNADLERRVSDLDKELNYQVANLGKQLEMKKGEIAKAKKEKEDEIARVKAVKDSLLHNMEEEINNNQIQITQLADKLKVSIVDKILFPSGNINITDEGLEVLQRVGDILNSMEDKVIRVEGHTDNVPIRGKLASRFPSNWELSTARATNVVRFLQDQVGVDPARLEAVGLGEYNSVASNDTKEGKAQNRRIEIMLLPKK